MSELKTNKVSPATGTALSVGDSGDTITVPSGATFTVSGTMNASSITAGTVATARLGSGTADATTFLRGDQSYAAPSAGGGFNSIQVFTASGSWTRPADITKVIVHVVGGGAGGGGGRSGYNYSGSGGGAGGNALKVLDVSSISTSTITIGAAGAGGAIDTIGSAGGNSSWADGTTTITCNGGVGGTISGGGTNAAGGTATGGDINAQGGPGETNARNDAGTTAKKSGTGGVSGSGFGGPGGGAYSGSSTDENDASGYGHGGAGGDINNVGGAGAGGLIWVEEYK